MSVRRGGRGGGPAGLWGGQPPGSGDRYFPSSSPSLSSSAPHHSPSSNTTSALAHGAPFSHPVPPPPYSGVSSSHSTASQGFAPHLSNSHQPPQGWRGGRGGYHRSAPHGGPVVDAGHSRGGRGGRGRGGDPRPFRGRGRGGFNKGCLAAVSCPGSLDDPWGDLHARLIKEFPRLEMPLDSSSPEVAKWRREQEEITWDVVSGSSSDAAHDPASEREEEMVSSESKADGKQVDDERQRDDSESMGIVEGPVDADPSIPIHAPAGESQHDTSAAQERKESGDQQGGDGQHPPVSGGAARKRVRDGETLLLRATVASSTRAPLQLPPVMHGPKNERTAKEEEGESFSTESQGSGGSHSSYTKEYDRDAEEAVHVEAATCAPEPRKSLLFSLPPPVMGGEKPSSPACNRRDLEDVGMSSFSFSSSSASSFSSVSTSVNGACSKAACSSSSAELSCPVAQRSDSSSSSDTPSALSSASPYTGAAASSPLRAGQSETGPGEPALEGPSLEREDDRGEPQGRPDKPDDAGGGELCLDLTTLRQRLQERGQRGKGGSR